MMLYVGIRRAVLSASALLLISSVGLVAVRGGAEYDPVKQDEEGAAFRVPKSCWERHGKAALCALGTLGIGSMVGALVWRWSDAVSGMSSFFGAGAAAMQANDTAICVASHTNGSGLWALVEGNQTQSALFAHIDGTVVDERTGAQFQLQADGSLMPLAPQMGEGANNATDALSVLPLCSEDVLAQVNLTAFFEGEERTLGGEKVTTVISTTTTSPEPQTCFMSALSPRPVDSGGFYAGDPIKAVKLVCCAEEKMIVKDQMSKPWQCEGDQFVAMSAGKNACRMRPGETITCAISSATSFSGLCEGAAVACREGKVVEAQEAEETVTPRPPQAAREGRKMNREEPKTSREEPKKNRDFTKWSYGAQNNWRAVGW